MSRDVGPEEVEVAGASEALEGMEEDAHVLVVPGGVVVVGSYVEDGEGARRGVIAVMIVIVVIVIVVIVVVVMIVIIIITIAIILSEKRTKLLGEIILRPGILRAVRTPRILLHEYRNGGRIRRRGAIASLRLRLRLAIVRRTRERRTSRQRRRQILRK